MQIEGVNKAELMKLIKYVASKEDPLVKIDRTHQHHANSTLLQTVKNFKKFSKVKQRKQKTYSSEHKKWEERRMHGKLPSSLDKNIGG